MCLYSTEYSEIGLVRLRNTGYLVVTRQSSF